MFPILAIGAALVGAFAVKEAVDASSDASDAKGSAHGGHQAQGNSAPLPQQSYLVTPVAGASSQPISALEAVRNFIV